MQRRSLGEVRLTGLRASLRRAGFLMMLGLAVLGFVGYLLPAHSVEGGAWHSNYADGGPWSLLVFAVFGGLVAFLRTRGFGAGIVTGVLSIAGAVAALAPVLLVHLLSAVVAGPGEVMFGLAVLGMFAGGVVMVIADPILYLTQRRADERPALLPIYSN